LKHIETHFGGFFSPPIREVAGWCFGTMEFYDFPFSWECRVIPTDELIFFRGVGSNHQPELAFILKTGTK
jgi:hypothetical protein